MSSKIPVFVVEIMRITFLQLAAIFVQVDGWIMVQKTPQRPEHIGTTRYYVHALMDQLVLLIYLGSLFRRRANGLIRFNIYTYILNSNLKNSACPYWTELAPSLNNLIDHMWTSVQWSIDLQWWGEGGDIRCIYCSKGQYERPLISIFWTLFFDQMLFFLQSATKRGRLSEIYGFAPILILRVARWLFL